MGSVALGALKGVKRSLEVKVGLAFTFTRRDGKSNGWKAMGMSVHAEAILVPQQTKGVAYLVVLAIERK